MSPNLVLFLVATLPVFALLLYFWHRDKGEKEPMKLMTKVFFMGIAVVLPIAIVEIILSDIGLAFFPNGESSLDYTVLSMFLIVALSEEFGKLWVVKKFVYKRPKFNEVMDGITYAILASLGFAILENILYTFQHGLSTGILRAFTAVPAHALFSGIMGFYIGLAGFTEDKALERRYLIKGLVLAVFFHGSYNSLLSIPAFFPNSLAPLLVFPLLAYMAFILHRAINMAHKKNPTEIKLLF